MANKANSADRKKPRPLKNVVRAVNKRISLTLNMAFREVCVYNNGERKNHKKAKGHIPSAKRKEEA
jgi:hypothetical protein